MKHKRSRTGIRWAGERHGVVVGGSVGKIVQWYEVLETSLRHTADGRTDVGVVAVGTEQVNEWRMICVRGRRSTGEKAHRHAGGGV